MAKNIFFIFILLLISHVQAQQIEIEGKVIIDNTDNKINYESINVQNLQTKTTSKVDSSGNFKLKVNLSDEIFFSGDFIENRKIKISNNILTKQKIEVHLDLEIIQLQTAEINSLDKNLEKNIDTSLSLGDQLNELFTSKETKKDALKHHKNAIIRKEIAQNNGADILGLVRLFFKPKQKPIIYNKIDNKYDKTEEIKDFFTENYFINDLKIPEKEVNAFILYCYNISNIKELYNNGKIEELIMEFEKQAINYLRLTKKVLTN